MKCPNCNKEFGYLRIKAKEWVCRHCGSTHKILTPKIMGKNFIGLGK